MRQPPHAKSKHQSGHPANGRLGKLMAIKSTQRLEQPEKAQPEKALVITEQNRTRSRRSTSHG
jgi:hypothetical protein